MKKNRILLVEHKFDGHGPTYLSYVRGGLEGCGIETVLFKLDELLIGSWRLVSVLQDAARRHECSLIYLLTVDGCTVGLLKGSLFTSKKIPMVGNYYLYNNLWEFPKKLVWDALFLLRRIDLLFVSDPLILGRKSSLLRRKVKFLPDTWDSISIGHGVDRKLLRERMGLLETDVCFLMIGDLSKRKGVDVFLSALDKVESSNVKGVMAGRLGNDFDSLNDVNGLLEKLVGSNKLLFDEGFVDDCEYSNYFCLVDYIVCPYPLSFKVSSGTFTNAMAMGRPVICSSHGTLGWLVNNKGLGLSFNSGNAVGLTDLMERLGEGEASQFNEKEADMYATSSHLKHYQEIMVKEVTEILNVV